MSDEEPPRSSGTTNAIVLWSRRTVEYPFGSTGNTSPTTSNGDTIIGSQTPSPVLSPSAPEFVPGVAVHICQLGESRDDHHREGSQDTDQGGVLLASPHEIHKVHEESHLPQQDSEHLETMDAFPEFDSRLTGVNDTMSKLHSTQTSLAIPTQRRPSSSEIAPRVSEMVPRVSEMAPRVHGSAPSTIDAANRIWRFEKPTRSTALEHVHNQFLGPKGTTIDDQFMQHTQHSIGPEDRDSIGSVSINIDQHSFRSTGKNLLAVNPGANPTNEPQNQRILNRKTVFATVTAPTLYLGVQRRLRRLMLDRNHAITPLTGAALEKGRLHHCEFRARDLLDTHRDEDKSEQVVTRKGSVGSAAVPRLPHLGSADSSNSLPTPVALQSRQQYGDSYQQLISAQLENPLAVDHRANRRVQHGIGSFLSEGANYSGLRSEAQSMVPTGYRTVESLVPSEWGPVVSVTRVPLTELSTAVYNTISGQPAAASRSAWSIPDAFHQQTPNINPNVRIPEAAISVPPARPTLPYEPHSHAMYPNGSYPSQKCQRLVQNGPPSYDAAIQEDYLPFFEAGRSAIPAQWGVIKITEAPYDVTKQEIRDHLGQNARILTCHYGEAIHIIMERANGKTGEVYVEFFSQADAQACVNDWAHVGRSKIRDRFVHVQMSSQAALMERLFPKARNVTWNGQLPIVAPPQPPFTGFRSFIDHEELLQLEKLADVSVRRQDSYSWKSPERAYENIISVLYKFPWFAVEYYTVADCNRLYWAVFNLAQELVKVLNSMGDQHQAIYPRQQTLSGPPRLTHSLLRDLVYAGLNAPGIPDRSKSHLLYTVTSRMPQSHGFDVKMSMQSWNWPWVVLTRKLNWEEDLVIYYMKLLNVADGVKVTNDVDCEAINLAHAPATFRQGTYLLPIADENVTVAERGRQERQKLESMLRLILR